MEKLKSDRLWALLGFAALLVANAMFDLGLGPEEIKPIMWSVLAFILGKSVRSTTGGTLFAGMAEAAVPKGLASVEAIVPDVPKEEPE